MCRQGVKNPLNSESVGLEISMEYFVSQFSLQLTGLIFLVLLIFII